MFLKGYIAGKSFKECLSGGYCRDVLKDIKTGKVLYTKDKAIEIANSVDAETNKLKNNFIEEHGSDIVSVEPYNKLEDIKYRVLKNHFIEEIRQ